MTARMLALALLSLVVARAGVDSDGVLTIGNGVTPPRVLRKKEPTYTSQARDAQVQGSVLLGIVIDEQGRTSGISVISPLGFGLDEAAIRAVEGWRFQPATKDGKPVKCSANVEVNFRFEGLRYDQKQEARRTQFNLALINVRMDDPKKKQQAAAVLAKLAGEKFAPAMYMHGRLMEQGDIVKGEREEARRLIREAAKKNYGPAIFETGAWLMNGDGVPKDVDKGLSLIREASVLGSLDAQRTLGKFAATGEFGPKSPEEARRYYRLCAAAGLGACQQELGLLMLGAADRQERHYLQAVGWLELAAAGGSATAKQAVEAEAAKLTASQRNMVDKLKPQLVRHPE